MIELTCIACPLGCKLNINEEDGFIKVLGHSCVRGEDYGRNELKNPTRVVTSTVKISGTIYRRCPVKTKFAIPKRLVLDAVRLLENIELTSPMKEGQVVVANILNTGIPFVTTRDL